MHEAKAVLAVIAALMTIGAYVPYIRDILKGKTTPHVFSWFLWSFINTIICALQISEGAGVGSLMTLTLAVLTIIVFLLSFFSKGKRDISRSDIVFLIIGFVSLGLWLFAKQPLLSTIFLTCIDVAALFPTVRKTWKKPYSETLSFYAINTVRFVLATLALEAYSLITALFPISWIIVNAAFVTLLIVRRFQVSKR